MSDSIRSQIQLGFGRVVSRYALLSGTLLVCLVCVFLFYNSYRNLESQSELVRTQLRAEITASLNQAETLIHSPILWTGLMDSFSHETVLKPLFAQLNRLENQRFVLLDYQGRLSIEAPDITEATLELARQSLPELKGDAVATLTFRTDASDDLLLILLPIMSPLSDAPLGYLMTQFSVTASLQHLNVGKRLDFDFALKPDFTEIDWWMLSQRYTDEIQFDDHVLSYHTRYAISLLPDVAVLTGFLLILIFLGRLYLNRTQKWLDTFSRQLTRQLDQLVVYARDIFMGKPVASHPRSHHDGGIDTVMKALESLLSEQAIAQDKLRKLAYEDALTGLPIYTRFREFLDKRLLTHKAWDIPITLIFIDIDKLKHINDIYGYTVGDQVIQHTAQLLAHHLPEPCMISRRTGDEFVAWLQVDTAQLQEITESITRFEINYEGTAIPISLTVGAASYPQDAPTADDLIFCAEYALKQAKQRARQSFVIFDNQLGQNLIRIKQIEARLTEAIRNCEIKPFYQPEVDMVTGQLTGVEALARWQDPVLGWISPTEFVPIVEHLRLSTALTHCILLGIFEDAEQIHRRFPGAKIAINVSPQDFLGDQLTNEVEAYAAYHQPNGLAGFELELTEQDIVDLDVDMLTKLDRLIEAGVRVAIDDFGTRYSSLSRLTSLPLHRLKIDCAFVANITDPMGEEVVRLIISLAKALDLDITAEGVETIEQRDRLIELGCIHAQGWLYQKALPLSDLLQLPEHLPPQDQL